MNFLAECEVGERQQAAAAGVGAAPRRLDAAPELGAVGGEGEVGRRLGGVRLEDADGGDQDSGARGAARSTVGWEQAPGARKRGHFNSG